MLWCDNDVKQSGVSSSYTLNNNGKIWMKIWLIRGSDESLCRSIHTVNNWHGLFSYRWMFCAEMSAHKSKSLMRQAKDKRFKRLHTSLAAPRWVYFWNVQPVGHKLFLKKSNPARGVFVNLWFWNLLNIWPPANLENKNYNPWPVL